MCKALEYANEFINIMDKINKDYDSLSREMSDCDKIQQDILHKIEFDNFNAADGYKLAKAIKDIREQRRIIKREHETLDQLKKAAMSSYKGIQTMIPIIQRTEEIQQKQKYHPRVLKKNMDLKLIVSK